MKFFYNLPIRLKFAVVFIPLIFALLFFDILQIRHKYADYNDAIRLNSAINLVIEINHIVHELQKERSLTSGFVSSDEAHFAEEITIQRIKTDSTIAQYNSEFTNPLFDDIKRLHEKDLEKLSNTLSRISELRNQADKKELTPDQIIDYYSAINAVALNIVNKLIAETRNKEIAQEVHGLIYFLKAKEQASIERAIGTKAFSLKHLGYDLYQKFAALVAAQNAYIEDFKIIASDQSVRFFDDAIQIPALQEVERIRQILFANDEFNEDPNTWYKAASEKINAFKTVEDYISENLHLSTESIAKSSVQGFWIFLIVDILLGLGAAILLSAVINNILENVEKLEDYTHVVSTGRVNMKIYIDTQDELGKYATAFNLMVEEIKKNQSELRQERDRARFLYQNIYKVSQSVFENIGQGIFLLDRDFKISRLYSRAMERIFSTKKIAGESFMTFIRPLILPREAEALEMYMRHLFNTEMDEDVVNQLNPIEQVKIYTESQGAVITKYIKVAFTRIYGKKGIQNIMVTISDETEAVLLQQHLDEAERQKKQETEQVLSMLKIDPSVMRGFIFNSKKTIREISERYESSNSEQLKDLLDYTFQTVHSLKGNALLIGLELMTRKFHDIEESISKLKQRDKISSKDFLSVLYEIDEADSMLQSMSDMLRKVANIYKKFPSEGQIVSNLLVIDTLQKGVEQFSQENKKSADLEFKNPNNVVIPENLINPFKDMMIQLVRNSIAHGIEDPKEREAMGKNSKAKIEISLDQSRSDELKIVYSDDGKGLDLQKIKEKALLSNLITDFEAQKLTVARAAELIFHKGFSTSNSVDNYSGRGQGMGLVQSIIKGLKGKYAVESEQGKGFKLSISLPVIDEEEILMDDI